GFWDNVSVGADTEYHHRLTTRFGSTSLKEVLPGIPLTFARVSNFSLTQQQHTHIKTQYKNNGVRRKYYEAFVRWHQQTASHKLYIEHNPCFRYFPVPHRICKGNEQQRSHNQELLAKQRGLFDSEWYLRRYPDVAQAAVD